MDIERLLDASYVRVLSREVEGQAFFAAFYEQFDDEVELAWRLVMTPGIAYMRFHYDRSDGDRPTLTANSAMRA